MNEPTDLARPRPPPTAMRSTSRSGRPPARPRGRGDPARRSEPRGLVSQPGPDSRRIGLRDAFPRSSRLRGRTADRGHAPSACGSLDDVAELLACVRAPGPVRPRWRASAGAARSRSSRPPGVPEIVDALALICPGLHPRVGVTRASARGSPWPISRTAASGFPVPLADPALFTAHPAGQAFIAADPLGLARRPPACSRSARSSIGRSRAPAQGASAGPLDARRPATGSSTTSGPCAYVEWLASVRQTDHRVSRRTPHA